MNPTWHTVCEWDTDCTEEGIERILLKREAPGAFSLICYEYSEAPKFLTPGITLKANPCFLKSFS